MKEIWKNIEGFNDKYQVSNFGRVKSFQYHNGTNERILKPRKVKDGYHMVALYKNKKQYNYQVHHLVASAFIKNPFNYSEINHIDGDKTNNCTDNLEWITHHNNILHYFKVLRKNYGNVHRICNTSNK